MTGRGSVADRLLRLAERGATGVLSLVRGQVQKQLYLRHGALVAAESNLREEALGEILIATGVLGRSRLPGLLAEVRRRGKKLGAVVVDLGWATADDVLAALAEQVRRRAQSCLRWTEGEYEFDPTSAFVGSVIEYPCPIPPVVFEGLRANASFEELLPLVDAAVPRYVALSPRFAGHQADFEATFGAAFGERIAAGTPVHDFVLDPEANNLIEALDALLASGLGQLGEVPREAEADPRREFDDSPGSFRRLEVKLEGDRLGAELAFNEGRSAVLAGQLDEAIAHFREAVALRPDQAAYHAWLGATLFQTGGRSVLPEALDRLEHAVAVDPDSADGHLFLARTLLAVGDGARARTHLESTLRLRPEQPEAIDRLVRIHLDAGELAEAERLYRRVLAALGERALPMRCRLWRELAALYDGPLCDPANGKRARATADLLENEAARPYIVSKK